MGIAARDFLGQGGHLHLLGHIEFPLEDDEAIPRLLGGFQGADMVECLFNRDFEIVEIDRFGHKIKSAPVHGGADVLHITVGGNDDRLDVGFGVFEFAQQREPVHNGHVDIREH